MYYVKWFKQKSEPGQSSLRISLTSGVDASLPGGSFHSYLIHFFNVFYRNRKWIQANSNKTSVTQINSKIRTNPVIGIKKFGSNWGLGIFIDFDVVRTKYDRLIVQNSLPQCRCVVRALYSCQDVPGGFQHISIG